MNYILSFILFLIIILSACIYWIYGTKTISGQVFIVTKGRGNVEMGSLDICFIEEKRLLEYGKMNFLEISKLISEIEIKIKSEEDIQKKTYKEFDYANKSQSILEMENEAEYIIFENFKMPIKVRGQYNELKSYYTKSSPIVIVMDKELIKLKLENSYPLSVFELGVSIAKTDSNGRFTAKIPLSKKGWLIAHGQRQVFDKVEEYYWLEPINSDTIMLTNDNLWE